MSNTSIQLKKSGATGNTPTGLSFGEVAINYADGKLYYKNSLGETSYISNQFSFDTINANNSLILATGVSDTLSFVAGDNISINTNTATKTIVISATSGGSTSGGIYANGAFAQANAAYTHANAAFNAANTGGSSTDSVARTTANAAYTHANAAFNAANTGGSSTDSVARTTANAAFVQANAAYASQNTTGSYANSAYTQANTATTNASTADSKAVTAGSYANSAYTQANTATNNAAGASLYANGAFIQANAAFNRANSVLGGFRANTLIVANGTGFLSNSNAEFSLSNNTLYVPNANISNEIVANSLIFYDGTRLNSATGINANTANSAATANVSIFARVTNVTTGTYFPIVTDTTITGADTFHYSSGDFLMYAANNTFRATGNVWAGEFLAVGSNIPVVNSTGHWVGQTISAGSAGSANTANVAINARITNVTTGTYFPIVTDTTITGSDTLHYSSNDFLMYAANNTFRATGNVWAGEFLAVGTNIPVVNSTGHWVGQTVNGIDSFARTTANAALPTTGGTVTGNLTLSTTSTMIIQNTRPTTSNSTGALIVRGGVGIAGNLFVGGIFTVDGDFQVGNTTSTGNVFNSGFVTFSQPTLFTSNAATTSNTTGAIISTGGIATRGNLFSGAIRITGPSSNGLTFADGTVQYTANAPSSSIANGSSNIVISTANGNIIANVSGNTIVTITANGFSTSGANGDISGANNIFSNFINVTSASIVSGVNVVPFIQSAFNRANNSLNANTGGRVTGNTVISNVDMANAIYSNVSFSVATQEDAPSAMSISADGKKMFVMGTTGDDVNEYDLTTPWLVSSATFVRVFSVASQENFPTGLFFRPDGLKFYVVGQTNDTVYQYALTTPWDLSTASYESKSFSVSSQDNNPTGIFFRPNGLSMYVTGSSTDSVHQYTLSTSWDVSTATFLQSFSVASEETVPQDLSFANDGSRMFVMGNIGDDVNIYNLSTSWNVSTAVFSTTFSVAAQDDAPIGMFIEVDGSRFYMLGSSNDTVYQYRLPMATIELTGNTFINGDINVLQNLNVDGSATFRNEIVSNNVISSNIYVSGYNVFTYITNAYIQANAAFAAANAGGAGTDQFARNTANAAFIQANAAFAVANTGGGGGGPGTDNVARQTANAAFIQANAAFAAANAGGSGTDQYARDTANAALIAVSNNAVNLLVYSNFFIANGNTSTFSVTTNPESKEYTVVNIDGVIQLKNTYSLSGNTIILSENVAANANVEITVSGGGGGGNTTVGFVTQNKTVIDSNVTIGAGFSAVSVGPLSIANNVVINIAAGQKWVIL
jgi:hypothetical protein